MRALWLKHYARKRRVFHWHTGRFLAQTICTTVVMLEKGAFVTPSIYALRPSDDEERLCEACEAKIVGMPSLRLCLVDERSTIVDSFLRDRPQTATTREERRP